MCWQDRKWRIFGLRRRVYHECTLHIWQVSPYRGSVLRPRLSESQAPVDGIEFQTCKTETDSRVPGDVSSDLGEDRKELKISGRRERLEQSLHMKANGKRK